MLTPPVQEGQRQVYMLSFPPKVIFSWSKRFFILAILRALYLSWPASPFLFSMFDAWSTI
jgi:hypothetical protein